MKRSSLGIVALTLLAFAGLPAAPALAIDVVPGMTLPAAGTLIGFQQAEQTALGASAGLTITRLNLEPDEGVWRYRAEGFNVRGGRVRVDINAFTGAVIRNRVDGGGNGSRRNREAEAIRAASASFTLNFAQAGAAASTARPSAFLHSVRLEQNGSALVYKAELVTATSVVEVRINPVTGAISSTQGGDDNGGGNSGGNNGGNSGGGNSGGTDDNGGGNSGGSNSGGNSGSGSSGSSGGGNSGGSSGNSGGGNGGGVPSGNLPNQPQAVAAAINTALAGKPVGTQVLESRMRRVRTLTTFEVVTLAPGATQSTETRIDLRTGLVVGANGDFASPDDVARIAAFNAALGSATPISYELAIDRAWNSLHGDVLKVEPGLHLTQPIFEVRILTGNRERSVKVNAITGAIVG